MLIEFFDLDEGLQLAESLSPSVLLDLAFDPVARSASQPGGSGFKVTRLHLEDVAVLRPRGQAQKSLRLFV